MTHIKFRGLIVVLALSWAAGAPAQDPETVSHGRFEGVHIYHPNGAPRQFVLFLSGDGGWAQPNDTIARLLATQGALVAGIDDRRLIAALERDPASCVFPDGDLENLSHFLQAYYHLPTYLTPVLAGYSAGSSLAYAIAAQSPRGIFSSVLTLGFSPDMDLKKPLCRGEGVHFTQLANQRVVRLLPSAELGVPWVNLTGDRDTTCPPKPAQEFMAHVHEAQMVLLPQVDHHFVDPRQWQPQLIAAYTTVTAGSRATLPAAPSSLADLPVIEVKATGSAPAGLEDLYAVMLSGDGGWAGIDKEVAAQLSAQGISVVGFDSLRYFWSVRTPAGLASDLDRLIRFYATHWHKGRVLLVGYSQGADVLPFALNRLPAATHSQVALTALIGPGHQAAFEFHLTNWIGSAGGLPIRPEADQLAGAGTLCLYGKGENDSLCPELPASHAQVIQLPGGHHFGGDYAGLARLILQRVEAGRAGANARG